MITTQIEDYCKFIIVKTFKSIAVNGDPVYIAMVNGFVEGYDYYMSLENEPIESFKMAGLNALLDAKTEFIELMINLTPMTSLEPSNIIAIKAKEYSTRTTKDQEYNVYFDHNLRSFFAFGFDAGSNNEISLTDLYRQDIEIVRNKLKNNEVKLNIVKKSTERRRFKITRR